MAEAGLGFREKDAYVFSTRKDWATPRSQWCFLVL